MSRIVDPRAFLLFVLGLVVIWEGVKLLGGDPLGAWQPPFDWTIARDLNMPHVWEIASAFVEPAQRNGPPLGAVLAAAAGFTLSEAVGGFVFGAALGIVLAVVFVHSSFPNARSSRTSSLRRRSRSSRSPRWW
jgi:ABC-type nitrate/sulfonate/bicarbonate transport system permease component